MLIIARTFSQFLTYQLLNACQEGSAIFKTINGRLVIYTILKNSDGRHVEQPRKRSGYLAPVQLLKSVALLSELLDGSDIFLGDVVKNVNCCSLRRCLLLTCRVIESSVSE